MPWKLVPPRPPKTYSYSARGKYCGIRLNHSLGTSDEDAAKRILKTWERQAERGEFVRPEKNKRAEPEVGPLTFVRAATAYMKSDGDGSYLGRIMKAWPTKLASDVDQVAVDTLATELYPNSPASTRNRQVYTPISATLNHVGVEKKIKRPKGWRGNKRTFWLQPEPTFRLLNAAEEVDLEFGIFCTVLNYTGMRLSEGFAIKCETTDISREFTYLPDTKTGVPRAVFLPPDAIAALAKHPRGLNRKGRVFRFYNGQRFYQKLAKACEIAEIELPPRVGFHVFRHNYGTWMRLYAGLDALDLLRTRVWNDMQSVDRYSHSEPTREARMASQLPTRNGGQLVGIDGKKKKA